MAYDGLLDTNVVIHALRRDHRSDECREFLALVSTGERRVRLEVFIVHELLYVMRRVFKQKSRQELADSLIEIIAWPGVDCERQLLLTALERWKNTPGLEFPDALLVARAQMDSTRVFTTNVKDFLGAGVEIPNPLLDYTP